MSGSNVHRNLIVGRREKCADERCLGCVSLSGGYESVAEMHVSGVEAKQHREFGACHPTPALAKVVPKTTLYRRSLADVHEI
jgi:hypothetical protein